MNEQTSFLELFLKHQDEVRAFINAVERQPGAREDLFQEVSLTLVKKFDDFDASKPFSPWAKGIARNIILNHWRKVGSSKVIFSDDTINIICESLEKVDELASAQKNALRHCFDKLPVSSRKVLNYKYEDGLSVQDVAKKCGGQFEATKKMLFRLRSKLRECVELELASEC